MKELQILFAAWLSGALMTFGTYYMRNGTLAGFQVGKEMGRAECRQVPVVPEAAK